MEVRVGKNYTRFSGAVWVKFGMLVPYISKGHNGPYNQYQSSPWGMFKGSCHTKCWYFLITCIGIFLLRFGQHVVDLDIGDFVLQFTLDRKCRYYFPMTFQRIFENIIRLFLRI